MSDDTFLLEQDIKKLKRKNKVTDIALAETTNIQQAWTPNNFMKSKGICIEDTLYPSEWLYPSAGILNVRRVADKKLFESGAILFDAVPSQWKAITKGINYDFASVNTIGIAFYIEDQYAFDYINIRITTDATKVNNQNDWTKYFESGNKYTSDKLHSGWNFIKLHKNNFTNVGTETWGNFRAIRFVIGVNANKYNNFFGGTIAETITSSTFGIGGIYLNPTHETPKLMLNFDDSQGSLYSVGFPIMRQKGVKATIYCCYDHVYENGGGAYMHDYQHQEWYNAGNDIGCHSKTHGDMWYMTKDQLYYEWNTILRYILDKGWTRGAYFGAYPKGEFNTTEFNVVKDLGFKLMRGRNTGDIDFMTTDDMLQYGTREITGTTVQATITGWIDKAIERGVDLSIFTHAIVESAPDSYSTTTAIFQAFIDYIVAKRDAGLLEIVTISEYYEKLTKKEISIPSIITGSV